MWILASRGRPHNVRRFFNAYKRTHATTQGIVAIDKTDPKILEYESLKLPDNWTLNIYPEMSMVERVNTVFKEYPTEEWYGNMDDDSVPMTQEWDKRLIEAAGKDHIAHCWNGIGNDSIVCQCVIGGDLAREIGWILLPTTKRIYGDQAMTDICRKKGVIKYLPDVRVEQYHFSNGKSPFDETYQKPSRHEDRNAYIDWYWKTFTNYEPLPIMDNLVVCCVMVNNYLGKGAEYVNKLHSAVERNLSIPHRFICFTDIPDKINCETRPIYGEGWFSKLYLFPNFTTGKVIYLDLDTIITGNLDFLDKYNGKFAILRDFYRKDGYGSGMMMWRGGFGHEITENYEKDGCPFVEGGDQIYIESQVRNAKRLQDLFPKKIVSYKAHAMAGTEAPIVCFHGHPKPHDFQFGWVKDSWVI